MIEIFLTQGCDGLGRGEGIIDLAAAVFSLLAALLREQLHRAPDGGNVSVLRDNKGDQHLPRILPEDADTLFVFGGESQKRV